MTSRKTYRTELLRVIYALELFIEAWNSLTMYLKPRSHDSVMGILYE